MAENTEALREHRTHAPKKSSLLRILQILHEETDSEHPISQAMIAKHLQETYEIGMERKAIARTLNLLREAGLEIESDARGCWLNRSEDSPFGYCFDDTELRLLIDSVLSCRAIPQDNAERLMNGLCSLSNRYFRERMTNVHSAARWSRSRNKALFYNVEVLDGAIQSRRRVRVTYAHYGTDGRLHDTSELTLSPYQLFLHDRRYFVMAYCEEKQCALYLKVDKITKIEELDEAARPLRGLNGFADGLPYERFATALPYLYADEPTTVVFRADAHLADQIVDWFGESARISADSDGRLTVQISSSPTAMKYWALQYADGVEVVAPRALREAIRASLDRAREAYGKE